ncbi:hypothetical protein [Sphingobacterium sp. MYb382]|uniref:hypothetical protein n=1 Tax=Sphingobacterium sp. MYb382 TaxID=2745278 RepID=UPI0030AF1A67
MTNTINKLFLFSIFIIFLLAACSKNNQEICPEPEPGVPAEDYSHIKLSLLSKGELNISENIEFGFTKQELDLRILDSINWMVVGDNEITPISRYKFDNTSGYYSRYILWSKNFGLPGEYMTYLIGYKGNKLAFTDSLKITIKNNKDFLKYNWKDITESEEQVTYTNRVNNNYNFSVKVFVTTKNTFIELIAIDTNSNPCNGDCFVYRDQLNWYITTLYGAPKFNASIDSGIKEYYLAHFKESLNAAEVLFIWETNKTKMALLKYKRQEEYRYKVIAEAKK